jgi:hypothetical protein
MSAAAHIRRLRTPNDAQVAVLADLVSVSAILGSTYLAIRIALEAPLQVCACWFLLAGGGLWVVLRARGHGVPTLRQWGHACWIVVLLSGGAKP